MNCISHLFQSYETYTHSIESMFGRDSKLTQHAIQVGPTYKVIDFRGRRYPVFYIEKEVVYFLTPTGCLKGINKGVLDVSDREFDRLLESIFLEFTENKRNKESKAFLPHCRYCDQAFTTILQYQEHMYICPLRR